MNKYFINIIIFFSLTINASFGSDSTLYKRRIEKIKEFAEWVHIKSLDTMAEFENGKSYYSRIYDTAIKLFFNKPQPGAPYNLKSAINLFSASLRFSTMDSFILRAPDTLKDSLLSPKKFSSYFENTIILYFPMYGEEFEGMYFEFASNSSKLIYLVDAGGSDEDYKNKKIFLNNLPKER